MIFGGNDPYDTVDDEDLYIGYRRVEAPKFRPIFDDDELPEHIVERLAEIRAQALGKYRENWG